MKKVTSTALLALQLTWKIVLLVFVLTLGVQLFFVCRELMPGGVPLQTTFGFETLIRSAVQGAGKWFMWLLMPFLSVAAAAGKGSKSVYTLNRLGLTENTATLIFGGVFTGYFLLYWAVQLAFAYGVFVWYSRLSLVSSNTFMLAVWRSEWLHTLLPLGEWWNYLRNLVICICFGCSSAFASQRHHRGKQATGYLLPPFLLGSTLLDGRIGSFPQYIVLTITLAAFTVGSWFVMKGGREDEDL